MTHEMPALTPVMTAKLRACIKGPPARACRQNQRVTLFFPPKKPEYLSKTLLSLIIYLTEHTHTLITESGVLNTAKVKIFGVNDLI